MHILFRNLLILIYSLRGAWFFPINSNDDNSGEKEFDDYNVDARRHGRNKPGYRPGATREPKSTVYENEGIGADSGSEFEYDGPKSEVYDPHHGFQMYWPEGYWVLPELYYPTAWEAGPTIADTREFCGRACPPMFKNYGPVCARNVYGNKAYDFDDYCEFYQQDCERGKGWFVAYRGRCDRTSGLNVYDRSDWNWKQHALNKADALLYNFMYSSPSTTTIRTTKRIVLTVALDA